MGRAPTPSIDKSDTEEESDGQTPAAETGKKQKQTGAKAGNSKTETGSKGTSKVADEPPESKPSTSHAKQSDEGWKIHFRLDISVLVCDFSLRHDSVLFFGQNAKHFKASSLVCHNSELW
jgi:hypothetical protein